MHDAEMHITYSIKYTAYMETKFVTDTKNPFQIVLSSLNPRNSEMAHLTS